MKSRRNVWSCSKKPCRRFRGWPFVGTQAGWKYPTGVKVQAAARALGLTLFLAEFQGTDVATAFPRVTRGRADALFVAISPVTYVQRNRIVEFAAARRLPASYQSRLAVEAGGLMSYSLNEIYLWPSASQSRRRSCSERTRCSSSSKPF